MQHQLLPLPTLLLSVSLLCCRRCCIALAAAGAVTLLLPLANIIAAAAGGVALAAAHVRLLASVINHVSHRVFVDRLSRVNGLHHLCPHMCQHTCTHTHTYTLTIAPKVRSMQIPSCSASRQVL